MITLDESKKICCTSEEENILGTLYIFVVYDS